MKVDLLLETFGSNWPDVRGGALAAEREGFDGVWVNDHLAGSVQNAPHVLECWTVLSALAAEVPRITFGSLVLNVANRDPGTLAVMAATLQQVSGGRLILGLGAGAKAGSPYAIEQEALGRPLLGDAERRWRVEDTIAMLRRVWSGAVPPATGFLRPQPLPPIVVAAMGPKMAEVAGRTGDGISVPVGPTTSELVSVAQQARAASGPHARGFLVTALLSTWPEASASPVGPDVERLIVYVAPPFGDAITRLGEVAAGWWTRAPRGE